MVPTHYTVVLVQCCCSLSKVHHYFTLITYRTTVINDDALNQCQSCIRKALRLHIYSEASLHFHTLDNTHMLLFLVTGQHWMRFSWVRVFKHGFDGSQMGQQTRARVKRALSGAFVRMFQRKTFVIVMMKRDGSAHAHCSPPGQFLSTRGRIWVRNRQLQTIAAQNKLFVSRFMLYNTPLRAALDFREGFINNES